MKKKAKRCKLIDEQTNLNEDLLFSPTNESHYICKRQKLAKVFKNEEY